MTEHIALQVLVFMICSIQHRAFVPALACPIYLHCEVLHHHVFIPVAVSLSVCVCRSIFSSVKSETNSKS